MNSGTERHVSLVRPFSSSYNNCLCVLDHSNACPAARSRSWLFSSLSVANNLHGYGHLITDLVSCLDLLVEQHLSWLRAWSLSGFLGHEFWLILHFSSMQAIYAEGKEHALAIGYTKMSAQDMYAIILSPYMSDVTFGCWSGTIFRSKFTVKLVSKFSGTENEHDPYMSDGEVFKCRRKSINKGIGVDNMHYLNDGLWKVPNLCLGLVWAQDLFAFASTSAQFAKCLYVFWNSTKPKARLVLWMVIEG